MFEREAASLAYWSAEAVRQRRQSASVSEPPATVLLRASSESEPSISPAGSVMETERPWLNEPELRARLGYCFNTIKKYRLAGLPHIGVGRRRRYNLAEVLAWLRNQEQGRAAKRAEGRVADPA